MVPRLTPAVVRALDILELFLGATDTLSGTQIIESTGIPKTTAYELLATLVHRGYLHRDHLDQYSLGVAAFRLSSAYTQRFDLLGAAATRTRHITSTIGEVSSVAILDGTDVFYLAKSEGLTPIQLVSGIGRRIPAHATALGKALLAQISQEELDALYPSDDNLKAFTQHTITTRQQLKRTLETTREQGFALELEESGPNVVCTAAVIRNAAGSPVAAVSISVPVSHWKAHEQSYWTDFIVNEAADFSAELGFVKR